MNNIRDINYQDYPLLETFLYECIYVKEGLNPPDFDIIYKPELQVYIKEYGNNEDTGVLYEIDNQVVGMAWARIMNDYGHIDDLTPSIAISVLKPYRNKGIGKTLLESLLLRLKYKGYKQVSLSVQKENYAYYLYKQLGFKVVNSNDEEYIMLCTL